MNDNIREALAVTQPKPAGKYPVYTKSDDLPPLKKGKIGTREAAPGDPRYMVAKERTEKGDRYKLIEVKRTAVGIKRKHVTTFYANAKDEKIKALIRELKVSGVM